MKMEVDHKIGIENHSGDGGNWSDSIATEFTDENWCHSTSKKEPTDVLNESFTPMVIRQQEERQLQNTLPYQQLMHTLNGPSTVDQQNQILHLLRSNPSLMSAFKNQKQLQSRMDGATDPMGPSQMQQQLNLQHVYPQMLQHQQPQPEENHRGQEQQFRGHLEMSRQQYGVAGGPAGQMCAEKTSVNYRAYDQLIDSLKRASSIAQQKKILLTVRSNPSLMAVYLAKCKQKREQNDGRFDQLDKSQINQQQFMQYMLPPLQKQHQCQPGMEINGRIPQVRSICEENFSTLHDEPYQQLTLTSKTPNSPNHKQQVLRNTKSNPSTVAALRKHRQKQTEQNSGAGSPVLSQSQKEESSLHPIVSQQLMQQLDQHRNQVYQQTQQMTENHQNQSHQEIPVEVERISEIDSENTTLKQSAAYQKLTEILKRPNNPERQSHILHLVRSNPLLRSAFVKKHQPHPIEQQRGTSVAQNKPLQQPDLRNVLFQQEEYQINQQLQQQSAQGHSSQQNQMHLYTHQQQNQQDQQKQYQQHQLGSGDTSSMQNRVSHHLMTALTRTTSPEKQQYGHHKGEVHPLHSVPPQQQQSHMQRFMFQQQNQQSQQQYSLRPSAQQYQDEALEQASPPSYEQLSPKNYGGFEQNYGQASWNPATPMQHLGQLVDSPSHIFSPQSNQSFQSVPSSINHSDSSLEGGPGPSPHYQHHDLSQENQNYSLDHELYVPSGILSLESYPLDGNATNEMLKITPQDLLDFVNKF